MLCSKTIYSVKDLAIFLLCFRNTYRKSQKVFLQLHTAELKPLSKMLTGLKPYKFIFRATNIFSRKEKKKTTLTFFFQKARGVGS